MFVSKICKAALAASLAAGLYAAPAHAIIVNDAFDGGYFNPAQSGRGGNIDVIAAADGVNYTFFGAFFTYDNAGNPFWFTIQPTLAEGQSKVTGFPVGRFNGGTFGDNFTAPSVTVIGTGTLDIESCNSVKISITTNAQANGLPNVNYVFQRLGGPSDNCAYKTAFTTCPTGTTAVAGVERTCALTGTITQNVTLRNNATYVLNGKVQVGQPVGGGGQTGTLTIEPGTVIKGGGGASDYLVVNPGSKIFAEGTPNAPIVFTGPTETGGSWAGIFIAGRAPVNRAATAGGTIAFEADAAIIFGGPDANDSSGSLRYVQIRNAGQTIAPNRELNCLTLGGVGAGTTLDHIQCHNGTDDAFEFFGGTVNAKYLVATGNDDDNLDMDYGYSGKIQYVYVRPDAQVDTADGRCVESDNTDSTGNQDSTPRTQPKIANLTCQGATSGATWFEGMRLRRGSGGNYFNVAYASASDACLRFNDTSTYTAVGNPPTLTGNTTISGGFVACTTNFKDQASPPFTVETWFNGQTGNVAGTAAAAFSGRFPAAGGPLDGTAVPINNDAFFDRTTYKGAFAPAGQGADWTLGWTRPFSL
jgi:hypothetical protein